MVTLMSNCQMTTLRSMAALTTICSHLAPGVAETVGTTPDCSGFNTSVFGPEANSEVSFSSSSPCA